VHGDHEPNVQKQQQLFRNFFVPYIHPRKRAFSNSCSRNQVAGKKHTRLHYHTGWTYHQPVVTSTNSTTLVEPSHPNFKQCGRLVFYAKAQRASGERVPSIAHCDPHLYLPYPPPNCLYGFLTAFCQFELISIIFRTEC